MKKKVCICLFCVIVCWGFCAHALEGETFALDGIEYQVHENKAHVISFVEEAEIVVLHETVNGYPVVYAPETDWGRYVFSGNGHTVIIEEGITTLRDKSFKNWQNLETLVLPSTLRAVGKDAFCYNMSNLSALTLPDGLETIGDGSFSDMSKLETLRLPSSLRTLGKGALNRCDKLQAYEIAEENQYFKTIDGILYSKDGRMLVRYPTGREGRFEVPVDVEEIDPSAFDLNEKMTILTIPEGVTALPSDLLWRCHTLTEVYIPSTVTKIELDTLPWYGHMSRVHVAEGNSAYFDIDGVLFERAHPEQILYFPKWGRDSYDIPPGVTGIDMNLFERNRTLTTITIPRGVTELPDCLFYECTSLERVSLPITLKRIGFEAFSDCFMLTNITLPYGLEEIENYAFSNCPGITEITLPDSLTTIGERAFDDDIVIYASEGSVGTCMRRSMGCCGLCRAEPLRRFPVPPGSHLALRLSHGGSLRL